MVISYITVDEDPMLKRRFTKAMGRAKQIKKKNSNIKIILEEKEGDFRRYKYPQAKVTKSEKLYLSSSALAKPQSD